MGGSGSVGGGGSIFASVVGTSGHSLHTNGEPINPPRGYHYQNGRSYCEAVTVNWQLRDVLPGLGGFSCVPGSELRSSYHQLAARPAFIESLTASRCRGCARRPQSQLPLPTRDPDGRARPTAPN